MISSLLYATKDLVSDVVNAFVVYFETVSYIVKDSFVKDEVTEDNYDSYVEEVEEAPKKKKKGKKKSK